MQQQTTVQGGPPPVQGLLALSGKLTIGAAVCFSEGVFTSIMAMMTSSAAFYQAGVVLAFFIWAAFFLRFRGTQIGREITALCFLELCARSIDLTVYLVGRDPSAMWYVVTCISVLKIMRVYMWQSSQTQQHGWGQHGLLGFAFAKKDPARWQATPWRKVLLEFALLLAIAVVITVGIKLLPPVGRVLLMWLVPFGVEFIWGPIQLRGLAAVGQHFATSARQPEPPAPLQSGTSTPPASGTASDDDNAVPPELLARFIAAYRNTKPALRTNLVEYAEAIGAACVEEAAKKAAKGNDKP